MKLPAAALGAAAVLGVVLFAFARASTEDTLDFDVERWERIQLDETDRVVRSYADLHGALMTTGDSYVQILDVQFGLTADGYLSYSKLEYLTLEGEVKVIDKTADFAELFTSFDEVRRGFVFAGSRSDPVKLYVDDLRIVVDGDGYFQLRFAYGYDETGQKVYLGSKAEGGVVPFAESTGGACKWKSGPNCTMVLPTCSSCGTAPACPCTGSGDCAATMITWCRPDRVCDPACDTEVIKVPPFGIPILVCFCP